VAPRLGSSNTTAPGERLLVIDALRGVASLLVAWYHFATVFPYFLPAGLLKRSAIHGWVGVPIFFVISGFVMPHALHQARYEPSQYGRFLLKRMVRLDLPCYASLVVVVLLGLWSGEISAYETPPGKISAAQVLLHLGYLNVVAGYDWLNTVLWSLAIELQYYFLVGVVFPLIAAPDGRIRLALFGLLGLFAFWVEEKHFLFHHLWLFLLGIHTFHVVAGLIPRRTYLLLVPLLAAGTIATQGWLAGGAGVATALSVAFVRRGSGGAVMRWLGKISYSLYLLHLPVGARVVRYGIRRFPVRSAWLELAIMVAALAASLGAAWLLWRWVERPAHRWSTAIGYRRESRLVAGAEISSR
jgi:peptidoglycan/LPS O-acetylase OafA/YrhL